MFGTEDKWRRYMSTLWELREAAYNRAAKNGGEDADGRIFRVFDLANGLIGALSSDDIDIDIKGNEVKFKRRRRIGD